MARKGKIKFTSFESINYRVVCGNKKWHILNMRTLSHTDDFSDIDNDYRALKKTWRKSKCEFDLACSKARFNDLFSHAGMGE